MISEKEFDKEAAMLAAAIGGQLNMIDRMSESNGRGMQANRVDVNSFINAYRNGGSAGANPNDPANRGYVSEQMVQSMVPDTTMFSKPDLTQIPQVSVELKNHIPSPTVNQMMPQAPTQAVQLSPSKLEEEIAAIKSLLERMNGHLSKMSGMFGKIFCNITEKEKLNK